MFMEDCLNGTIKEKNWDKAVDQALEDWHHSSDNLEVYDFIGMTRQEYISWAEKPDSLRDIINARKNAQMRK